MPIKYSKLSNYRVKKVLKYFCEDLNATQTAKITGINRNTINRYYRVFREKIGESINKGFRGEIELDESYFGGKGRRGRGTAKIPVFGILKRNGWVYTQNRSERVSFWTPSPLSQGVVLLARNTLSGTLQSGR